MENIEQLKDKIKDMDSLPALTEIEAYLAEHPNDDEAIYLRGVKHWSLGQRSQAIQDYLEAIRLNPESKAKMAIKTAYEILNFYNKDLFNP